MRECDSIDYARGYARELVVRAKQRLANALPPGRARTLLLSMADFFIRRSS
jgi:geranylgeranyl pyrophosphate synthase